MEIPAAKVKQLREQSGAGFMDCKKALAEASGDMDKAYELLRKQDKAKAAKKAGREASEGLVHAYIHAGGRIGVLVEVNCETDFAAQSDPFKALVKDIAMHIAASDPRFLTRDAVPADVLEAEREVYRAQAQSTGKPEAAVEKIVEGKLKKFYTEQCLEEQPFVKDPATTIKSLVEQNVARIGENIRIRRFVRYKVGESDRNGDQTAAAAQQES